MMRAYLEMATEAMGSLAGRVLEVRAVAVPEDLHVFR